MPNLESDVPQQIQNLFDDLFDLRGNLASFALVQKHHIHIAERI